MPVNKGDLRSVNSSHCEFSMMTVSNIIPYIGDIIIDGISFSIKSHPKPIDFSTISIRWDSDKVFDGQSSYFSSGYDMSSSFSYNSNTDEYDFSIKKNAFPIREFSNISVSFKSSSGQSTERVYQYRNRIDSDYDITKSSSGGSLSPGSSYDKFPGFFISPSVDGTHIGNKVDIMSIKSSEGNEDKYEEFNYSHSSHPFIFGPASVSPNPIFPPNFSSDYAPKFNDSKFKIVNTKPVLTGILIETLSGNVTRILY
jgi:hypothetical protein